MDLLWPDFKAIVDNRQLFFQWEQKGNKYALLAIDGRLEYRCSVYITETPSPEQVEFETSYKANGNKPLNQVDTDGANIVRIKAAKKGWSFWSVPIEVVTSTLRASLFCQDSLGNDIPWISAKIYDGNNTEITTAGLLNANLNTCVKTTIDFEPTFNYEIIGGSLRVNSNPTQDVRLWIVAAPDIPAQFGGSKEFGSGINIKFLSADNSWDIDGRVTKAVMYDPINHSGKIRMIIKHPAGLQVNLMFIAQIYRQ